MESFDKIYSVSDLHLGGPEGLQIFRQGHLFRAMCAHIARADARARVAFVVNGDVVDFLAEEGAAPFDAPGALRKLSRIAADASFTPVFEGLREIVEGGGTVVFCLGNHDLELALHDCQGWLTQELSGGRADARERIRFATDGAGFRCEVKGASVRFTHGNEWDSWNVVDHAALREVARAWREKRTLPRLPTNNGTRLVLEVMNPIKARYRFVDLLKPEGVLLGAMLLAVDERNREHLGGFVRLWLRRLWVRLKSGGELLGSEAELDAAAAAPGARESVEQAVLEEAVQLYQGPLDAGALLLSAETRFRAGKSSFDFARSGEDDLLGGRGISSLRRLIEMLLGPAPEGQSGARTGEEEVRDRTFLVGDPTDDLFERLDGASGECQFIVAGHTHLRKAMKRALGPGFYFNSGTWSDLLAVPEGARGSDDQLDSFVRALEANELEARLIRQPTVVVIDGAEGVASGHLAEPVLSGGRVSWRRVSPVFTAERRSP